MGICLHGGTGLGIDYIRSGYRCVTLRTDHLSSSSGIVPSLKDAPEAYICCLPVAGARIRCRGTFLGQCVRAMIDHTNTNSRMKNGSIKIEKSNRVVFA